MDNLYQPVGSFYHDGKCDFVVWAPLKNALQLVVDFPFQQEYEMQKDEAGYWKKTLQNVAPGLRYFYKIDNAIIRPDPASVSQPDGVHQASEVIERNFEWTDLEWKGRCLDDLIIYEIHTGAFTQEQTFEGIIQKLDYVKELGINAIEIMPVAQFPGSRNWGYDGVYPYATQNSYGGANGLKELVNAAHEKGIAVLLDVVYNHLGPEGGYQSDFAPYYTAKHKTPWGNAINFDDEYSDGVRSYFLHNALMWLDEYHIDGLRMDAVHAIVDYGAKHFTQVLKKFVRELEEKSGKTKVLIAELDLNNPKYINPESKRGYGLDGQWIDEFHHALRTVLTGETNGYYEDFGGLCYLEKAFRDTYVYNGCYSPHRKKIFGASADENHYGQFVVFAQNHDQIGNRLLGDRLTTLLSLEELKLAAAVVLLSPYVPMLFMGEEWGETAPFLYFTSHSDNDLIKNVSQGRKKEFAHFQFKGEFPDPQAEETFQKSMLQWENRAKTNVVLQQYYKHLILLRKECKALQAKERESMTVFPVKESNVLTIERKNGAHSLLLVFNFNKEVSSYQLPVQASCKKIFDSSSGEWNGSGKATPAIVSADKCFTLNPMSVLVFELDNYEYDLRFSYNRSVSQTG